jgi:hypothetical protein
MYSSIRILILASLSIAATAADWCNFQSQTMNPSSVWSGFVAVKLILELDGKLFCDAHIHCHLHSINRATKQESYTPNNLLH